MTKVVVNFRDTLQYCNIVADDMHEDGEFLKVYNGNELVGMFVKDALKTAWKSEQKE